MIPQQFIEEIQARTDIVELISSYIPLKRAGRNYKALCPFHNEKTPSFVVSPQKQIFHCFGCGEGGGGIQFLLRAEKVSFVEAIEILAKRIGLDIPYQNSENKKEKEILYEAAAHAMNFFQESLLHQSAQGTRDYLLNRGIDKETIAKFRIGYAPGKNAMLNHLRQKGFSLQVLEKASLIVPHESGYKDLFRDRVVFPIFDMRGRVIGFGARLWKQTEGAPKYINSFENPLYSKREQLFGLNFSKDDIVKNDSAIVVEGYLDMITPFIGGIRNIIASSGTAFTIEQIRLLRRYTSRLVLIFDSDKAGQSATLRALDVLLENEMDVKIAQLPSGYDPDSFVREKGKDAFLQRINERQDFFDYKISMLRKLYDACAIEGKMKIVREMFSTIIKLPSEVARYEYIKKLSHSIDVKEEILIAEFRKFCSSQKRDFHTKDNAFLTQDKRLSVFEKKQAPLTEKIILKFLLTNEKTHSVIKKNVRIDDFTSLIAQKTASCFFEHYVSAHMQGNILCSVDDNEIRSFVSEILLDETIPLDKEGLRSSIKKLQKNRKTESIRRIKEEMRDAEHKGDKEKVAVLVNRYDKIRRENANG